MVASEAEGRAEALRRIAACRTARAEELDLGGLQLMALDGEPLAALCQLGWLRRLFLGLSAEAREKPQLAYINGGKNSKVRNAFGALPGALFDALTRLERLDLAFNGLRGLPASIANLTALTSLDLQDNYIGAEGAQALIRIAPDVRRIALIFNPQTSSHALYLPSIEAAAVSFAVELHTNPVLDPAEIEPAMGAH